MIAPATTPRWMFHPRRDHERASALAGELDAPLPAAHALVNRGFDTAQAARRFLEPSLDDLHDPFALLDIARAADRICLAVERGERILIHGDYDVDGITSTYLLYAALSDLGGRAEYRIPHRTRDGYGLSMR